MKSKYLFCCYSIPLKKFLVENGMNYELEAENSNTHKSFWVFMKSERLNNLLDVWGSNKPK